MKINQNTLNRIIKESTKKILHESADQYDEYWEDARYALGEDDMLDALKDYLGEGGVYDFLNNINERYHLNLFGNDDEDDDEMSDVQID